MSEQGADRMEAQLRLAAGRFRYPPTPEVAATVGARLRRGSALTPTQRFARALVMALILVTVLLTVPLVRAGLLEVIRIGAVRILLAAPTSTDAACCVVTATAATGTPRPTPTPIPFAIDLAGETSLAKAQAQVNFPILLPTYPDGIGQPDKVFVQNLEGWAVVLVWLDPEQPEGVRLSIQAVDSNSFALYKIKPQTIQQTVARRRPAVWAQGPYLLETRGGSYDAVRLITGHVLIWEEGAVTYRVETDLPLEEAVRIAEGLK